MKARRITFDAPFISKLGFNRGLVENIPSSNQTLNIHVDACFRVRDTLEDWEPSLSVHRLVHSLLTVAKLLLEKLRGM